MLRMLSPGQGERLALDLLQRVPTTERDSQNPCPGDPGVSQESLQRSCLDYHHSLSPQRLQSATLCNSHLRTAGKHVSDALPSFDLSNF